MSADEVSLKKIYDELISMRRRQEEDKFLSKIDAMFGILASIMIFVSGLVINNSLSQGSVNLPLLFFGLSTIFLFAVVLVGQFIAILIDDIGFRFYFWVILINGGVQVPVQIVSTYLMFWTHESLVWWPLNLLSFFLVPYCLVMLERKYFGRFSEERTLSRNARIFLFHFSDWKRQSPTFRYLYFIVIWMGVRFTITIPEYVLMRFFLLV